VLPALADYECALSLSMGTRFDELSAREKSYLPR
jgi:D-alanyl-D-alanine dipeptidase